MEKKIVVSELNEELRQDVQRRIKEGTELLQINESHSPQEVIRKIYDYINNLPVDTLSEKEIEEYAYKLGSIWGLMIEKEYGWSWKYFKHQEEDLSGVYLVSPKSYYCNSPLSFIYDNIAGNKVDANGDIDNTVVLLFNTMDGVDTRTDGRKYVLLA